MKAVSNASPIIFLSKIDALDLLPQCFDEILIPSAVADELIDYHPPAYIQQIPISPAGSEFVRGAIGRLHIGELEAIVFWPRKHKRTMSFWMTCWRVARHSNWA